MFRTILELKKYFYCHTTVIKIQSIQIIILDNMLSFLKLCYPPTLDMEGTQETIHFQEFSISKCSENTFFLLSLR